MNTSGGEEIQQESSEVVNRSDGNYIKTPTSNVSSRRCLTDSAFVLSKKRGKFLASAEDSSMWPTEESLQESPVANSLYDICIGLIPWSSAKYQDFHELNLVKQMIKAMPYKQKGCGEEIVLCNMQLEIE
jgi:hypothetical protein